ncbi:MAG: zinc-binding alcohol dehydrogenase family protein [Cyanobacteria bacterium J06600_6]
MRNYAVCGNLVEPSYLNRDRIQSLDIEGVKVNFGLIHTQNPEFDRHAPENEQMVLVKTKAFSCNYRDKSIILSMATRNLNKSFYVVGSEFVGEVVEIGAGVTEFQLGDRVIGDGCYPHTKAEGVRPGLPTNNGSKEYQKFHQAKLIKIPPEMPDEVAAAFQIGGQTSYSMIRKLKIQPGENVLVTAAKSNTSLFVINALKQHNVNVYALTTSMQFADQLQQMGVKELIQIDPQQDSILSNQRIVEICQATGGFDCVIDPFFDLYLGKVIKAIAKEGRYITCGLYNQYSQFTNQEFNYYGSHMAEILSYALLNNIQIIGNCIGYTEDLKAAINDYQQGKLNVVVDSIFDANNIKDFFEKTYNNKQRFGKVICQYS